jgi:hypothetical protein
MVVKVPNQDHNVELSLLRCEMRVCNSEDEENCKSQEPTLDRKGGTADRAAS